MLVSGSTRKMGEATIIMAGVWAILYALKSELLMSLFMPFLFLWVVVFAGRNVEIGKEGITLRWGYILKRQRTLRPGDILDVIDAANAKHLLLRRYMPEAFLAALVFILLGLVKLFSYSHRAVGITWIMLGGTLLIENSFSQKDKGKAVLCLLTLIVGGLVLDYRLHGDNHLLLGQLLFLIPLALILWWVGPIANNLLLIITQDEVYSVIYGSKDEVGELLRALGRSPNLKGGGNESRGTADLHTVHAD